MALLAEKRKQLEADLQLRKEEEARQEEEERLRVIQSMCLKFFSLL